MMALKDLQETKVRMEIVDQLDLQDQKDQMGHKDQLEMLETMV